MSPMLKLPKTVDLEGKGKFTEKIPQSQPHVFGMEKG